MVCLCRSGCGCMCLNLNENVSVWSKKSLRKSSPRRGCEGSSLVLCWVIPDPWISRGRGGPQLQDHWASMDLEAVRVFHGSNTASTQPNDGFLDYMMAMMQSGWLASLHLETNENSLPILLLCGL